MTTIAEPIQEAPEAAVLPAPGFYPGISYEAYAAWPALSRSILDWGTQSIEHLKAAVDGRLKPKESDALDFGRALHARLLEPMRYRAQWAVCDIQPDDPTKYKVFKITKEYKAKEADWKKAHAGMERISQDDYESIEGMARRVYAHPVVKLLRAAGGTEESITWIDKTTGIALKSRLDKFIPAYGRQKVQVVIDLKGVLCAAEDELSRAINNYGWNMQGAMYCKGVEELTGQGCDYFIVAIEKSYPYTPAVRRLGEASQRVGRAQLSQVLHQWAMAQDTGKYPGYGDDIQDIDIPQWELKKWIGMEDLSA